jgi:Regulator of volume decrease after cellular swelling
LRTNNVHVAYSRVLWLSNGDRETGYSVDFTLISMHAIATPADDPDTFTKPYLYVQLNQDDDFAGEGEGEEILPEMHLVPADTNQRTFLSVVCFMDVQVNDARVA